MWQGPVFTTGLSRVTLTTRSGLTSEETSWDMWFSRPSTSSSSVTRCVCGKPDLLFVSNERADISGDRIEGGPDLVVEIIPPSNTRAEIESKLADYAGINVRECWLVYPQIHAAEMLRLEGGEWQRTCIRGSGESLDSVVLPGLELNISDFFEGT